MMLNKNKILEKLPIKNIVVLDVVNSTNQYVIDNISYFNSGDACISEHQTHGRGQYGRKWLSSFGQNICLSIYWRLYFTPSFVIPWSFIISVIIARILNKLGALHIKIKWPNDLYVRGCKLAGVLVEILTKVGDIIHIIIGIGINVSMIRNQQIELYIKKKWINTRDIGLVCDRNTLVSAILFDLYQELKIFEYYKFSALIFHKKFFIYLHNKPVVFLGDNNFNNYGYFFGINNNGELMIKDQFGIIYCFSRKKNFLYIDF